MKTEEQFDLSTMGGRIEWARVTLRGWSQKELADRVKPKALSTSTVGMAESNPNRKPREWRGIARALQVNPDWLETGRGNWQLDAEDAQAALWDESPLTEAQLRQLLADLGDLLPPARNEILAKIHDAAEQAREQYAHLLRRAQGKSPVKVSAERMSSSKASVAVGLPLSPSDDPWRAKPNDREAAFYQRVEKAPKARQWRGEKPTAKRNRKPPRRKDDKP